MCCCAAVTTGTLGLIVSVTSEHTPTFVERAIRVFLDKMQGVLEEMSEQEFAEHVQSVATMLLQAPHNIDEQVACHWNTIWEMQYSFYDSYKVLLRPIHLVECMQFCALQCCFRSCFLSELCCLFLVHNRE